MYRESLLYYTFHNLVDIIEIFIHVNIYNFGTR
jgi:hypothetical protein